MNGHWQNNIISKRLSEEYPHDFSICDIDGACRCFYKEDGKWKIRLIIYECKYSLEKITPTQLDTLMLLQEAIDWKKLDDKSGVYIMIGDDKDFNKFRIHDLRRDENRKIEIVYKASCTLPQFYKLVSAKDKRK